MDALISVIIPTYRRPNRLLRAISSVLSQSYGNFEILIINDDKQDVFLEELLLKLNDTRIRLLNNERSKGANGARNTGIIHSKGSYLAFLDDDDEWMKNALETQLKKIYKTKDDIGIVYGGYYVETKSGWRAVSCNREGDLFEEFLIEDLKIGASSNIFLKKNVIEKVGLWDEELQRQQDLEFLIRVLKNFKIISNQNTIIKIYGHNTPNPEKAFIERNKYLKKISEHLLQISEQGKNKFLSDHYRRQTFYLIKLNKIKKAKEYWGKASEYKKLSIRKDVKILISLMQNILIYRK